VGFSWVTEQGESLVTTYAIIAEDAAPATPDTEGAPQGGGWQIFIMMGLIFAVFYFLLIRPQRKKEKERQQKRLEMLNALKKNDHVVTIGGIHGVVVSFTEKEVVMRVDDKTDARIRMERDAISRVVGEGDETGQSLADPAESK
jgi:preprotein translocase subunit YajC